MAKFEAPAQQQEIIESVMPTITQYKLRLSKDGSYKSDLQTIRDGIRANGTKQVLREIE